VIISHVAEFNFQPNFQAIFLSIPRTPIRTPGGKNRSANVLTKPDYRTFQWHRRSCQALVDADGGASFQLKRVKYIEHHIWHWKVSSDIDPKLPNGELSGLKEVLKDADFCHTQLFSMHT
jgi:hypothetical protein